MTKKRANFTLFWVVKVCVFDLSCLTSVQVETMELDLNQNPSPGSEVSPWLNELETTHSRIEERIRQLHAIVSRIRQRETTTTTQALPLVPSNEYRDSSQVENNGDNKTYLIAKALNMERTSSTVPWGGYFDCNICLEKAQEPVLTCCGHLFCWGCFYNLPLVYLNIKECPVCVGEVTDTEVIPIYGNNGDDRDSGKGLPLPPRPSAKRVESVRQKIIGLQALLDQEDEFGLSNIVASGGGGDNSGQQQQHHHPPFASFPSLVVHTSEIPPFDDADSFVDATSLRRSRRRSSRIAEVGVRASLRRRSQTVNPTGVVTSASSSRRRTEDVNSGPQTTSRRRRLR